MVDAPAVRYLARIAPARSQSAVPDDRPSTRGQRTRLTSRGRLRVHRTARFPAAAAAEEPRCDGPGAHPTDPLGPDRPAVVPVHPGAGDVNREEIERSLHSDDPAWRRS